MTGLAFLVQPARSSVRSNIAPAIQVAFVNACGAVVPTATGQINLSVSSGPVGSVLSGTTQTVAINGIATFAGVSLTAESPSYRLIASSSAGMALSLPFEIYDLIAPAAPTDFLNDSFANTATSLGWSWTSPGDDGSLGDNVGGRYRLCYGLTPLPSVTCLDSLDGGLPPPEANGFPESAAVTGLTSNTLYFASLRVFDSAGNSSVAFVQASTQPCAIGYAGPSCTQCAGGFVLGGGGACVPICTTSPCTSPPPSTCNSATVANQFTNPGACAPSPVAPFYSCMYSPVTVNCATTGRTCSAGQCVP